MLFCIGSLGGLVNPLFQEAADEQARMPGPEVGSGRAAGKRGFCAGSARAADGKETKPGDGPVFFAKLIGICLHFVFAIRHNSRGRLLRFLKT
jgi:hypothetical protein